MADFTEFLFPAPEWVEYDAAHPVPDMPPGISHDQRKALFNTAREKAFAAFFGPISTYGSAKCSGLAQVADGSCSSEGVASCDVSIPSSDGSFIIARIYRSSRRWILFR
jgi:hypothetical protein